MDDEQPSEQYILIADFLGFKNAVETWVGEKRKLLIDMMRWISTARASFGIRTRDDHGAPATFITPQISTFSDLLAVSFPVEPGFALPSDEIAVARAAWPGEVLGHMALLAAAVSMRSLWLGLPLRGGICRSELLHKPSIIFGAALVRAYEYERDVAKVPRLAVSPEVYADHPSLFPGTLRMDKDDGIADLDFMAELSVLLNRRADRHGWRASRLQHMEDEIARHANIDESIAGKWRWLRTRFEQGTLGLDPKV